MKITWLTQSGLLFENGNIRVMVDPYFSDSVGNINPEKKTLELGEGEYLFWVGNGSDDFGQGVGVYSKDGNQNDPRVIGTYIDGEFTDKAPRIDADELNADVIEMDSKGNFFRGLVIAVEIDLIHGEACFEQSIDFTAGNSVCTQPLFRGYLGCVHGAKGLAGV